MKDAQYFKRARLINNSLLFRTRFRFMKASVLLICPLVLGCGSQSEMADRITPVDAAGQRLIPEGHAAWVYSDFVGEITEYNLSTTDNKINNIYLVGGEINVKCTASEACERADLRAFYYADPALLDEIDKELPGTRVIPTLDGRVGSEYVQSSFNTLDFQHTLWLALEVGSAYCSQDVPGVQVDIEPFEAHLGTAPGQLLFYSNLADVLAGRHDGYVDALIEDPVSCKTDSYPEGRFFSIFMSAKKLDSQMVEILSRNGNGYVDVSGYDIVEPATPFRDGEHEALFASPASYKAALTSSIREIQASGVDYRIGLPFAASQSEFETLLTDYGSISGFPQSDYVNAAKQVMEEMSVCMHEHFIGIAVWGFSDPATYGNTRPSYAGEDTLSELQTFRCNNRF